MAEALPAAKPASGPQGLTTEEICKSGIFKEIPVSPIDADGQQQVVKSKRMQEITFDLVDTYTRNVKGFRFSRKFVPQRVLTKITDPARHNSGFDNAEHDLICKVGDIISDEINKVKYEIQDWLGQGSFGQVIKVVPEGGEPVALKIIKNKQAYFKQAQVEIQVLCRLNRVDEDDTHHIVRMKGAFEFKKHLCVAFELLNMNLYDVLKQGSFKGVTPTSIRIVTRQILEALRCLSDEQIIHCDLKPENVMIQSLSPIQIKLIDFGSACLARDTVHTYIQSRFYRSPEVLLGIHYTTAIDMWSLGCIAAELYLGLPIFPGNTEFDQVKRIVEVLGMPPVWMLKDGAKVKRCFKRVDKDDSRSRTTLQVVERRSGIESLIISIVQCGKCYKHKWNRLERPWKSTDGPFGQQHSRDLDVGECFVEAKFSTHKGSFVEFNMKTLSEGKFNGELSYSCKDPKSPNLPEALESFTLKAKEGHHIVGFLRGGDNPLNIALLEAPIGSPVPVSSEGAMATGEQSKAKDAVEGSSEEEEEQEEKEMQEEESKATARTAGDKPKKSKRRTRNCRLPSTFHRLKTDKEYILENMQQVGPCKKYFDFDSIESMIACVPKRSSHLPAHVREADEWFRKTFLQWMTGVLELNPEERWTPRMALQHPMVNVQFHEPKDADDLSSHYLFDPEFKPIREELDSTKKTILDASCAPSAPSMPTTSEGSSASSPAGTPHGRGGRSNPVAQITMTEAMRRYRQVKRIRDRGLMPQPRDADARDDTTGAASAGSASSAGAAHAATGRGQPCGAGDSSPWHGPSPMSEQSTGTASERIPSSNFSGTESGGEFISRASASHSEASGRPGPNSAQLSDSDNASAGAEEQGQPRTGKGVGTVGAERLERLFGKEWLLTRLPPQSNVSPRGVTFREALGLRKSGPVVADRAVSGSNLAAASTEDAGHPRFAPPARAGSGDSTGGGTAARK